MKHIEDRRNRWSICFLERSFSGKMLKTRWYVPVNVRCKKSAQDINPPRSLHVECVIGMQRKDT